MAKRRPDVRIGTAGWSIPKEHAAHFPAAGSHLARYGGTLRAVEINSSFYRPHRPATYARWAETVPDDFRFAVKVPREVTHNRRLKDGGEAMDRFLAEVSSLGKKLGPLLVQLPPSLPFAAEVAGAFFTDLRDRFAGQVVCEPRHKTWFDAAAEKLLADFQVARVAADPAVVPAAAEPGGWDGLVYYRLHGSPQMYTSPYPEAYLNNLAKALLQQAKSAAVWCVFDNTAAGAATENAVQLVKRVE